MSDHYKIVHADLTALKGPARHQVCVDCNSPACHWSYDYADPYELRNARGLRFSTDQHYRPRCAGCHRRFDVVARKSPLTLATDEQRAERDRRIEADRAERDQFLAHRMSIMAEAAMREARS